MLALMEKGVPFVSHYIDMLQFDQHKPEHSRSIRRGRSRR
jgi:glutathione S-transferase/GST-like protein